METLYYANKMNIVEIKQCLKLRKQYMVLQKFGQI